MNVFAGVREKDDRVERVTTAECTRGECVCAYASKIERGLKRECLPRIRGKKPLCFDKKIILMIA